MDRVLKVKDLIIGIVTFIVALFTWGWNIGNWQGKTVKEVELLRDRVRKVEDNNEKLGEENKMIRDYLDNKLEPMRRDIVDIKVLLQNKEDRR